MKFKNRSCVDAEINRRSRKKFEWWIKRKSLKEAFLITLTISADVFLSPVINKISVNSFSIVFSFLIKPRKKSCLKKNSGCTACEAGNRSVIVCLIIFLERTSHIYLDIAIAVLKNIVDIWNEGSLGFFFSARITHISSPLFVAQFNRIMDDVIEFLLWLWMVFFNLENNEW